MDPQQGDCGRQPVGPDQRRRSGAAVAAAGTVGDDQRPEFRSRPARSSTSGLAGTSAAMPRPAVRRPDRERWKPRPMPHAGPILASALLNPTRRITLAENEDDDMTVVPIPGEDDDEERRRI